MDVFVDAVVVMVFMVQAPRPQSAPDATGASRGG
jgi:hypothetical protein